MPRPATGSAERRLQDDFGWPEPQARPRPRSVPRRPPPARRSRGLDGTRIALVLAILGLLLAAAAGLWYSRLDRSSPPSQLTVPPVVGLRQDVAVRRLTTLGLKVRAIAAPGTAKVRIVVTQRPRAGATLARGTIVTIALASRT